jgi:PKD repeat protein
LVFDANVISRDIANGCGNSCDDYPIIIRLFLKDAHGAWLTFDYALNYGEALEARNESDYRRIVRSVTQGQWVRDISYRLRDAFPMATQIAGIELISSGWNFDGRYDNLRIASPRLTMSPMQLRFGSLAAGIESSQKVLTVRNETGQNVRVGQTSVIGNPAFVIDRDQCSSTTLSLNATCNVFITVTPDDSGTATGVLTIPSGGVLDTPLPVLLHADVTDLEDGLAGQYRFDSNLNDSSINANPGKGNGSIGFTDGVVNDALQLKGAMNEYVRITNSAGLASKEELTLSAWVKVASLPSSAPILSKGLVKEDYSFWIDKNGALRLVLNGGTSRQFDQSDHSSLGLDEWNHVAVTYSKTQGQVTFYLNGEATAVYEFNQTIDQSGEDLIIGSSYPGVDEYFAGTIDELRIYSRALSSAELRAISRASPYPAFSIDKTSGEVPLTVHFKDESSSDYPIQSWEWDFDADGTADAFEANPVHTYSQEGTYTVSLTVSDGVNRHTETKHNLIGVYAAKLAANSPWRGSLQTHGEQHLVKLELTPGDTIRLRFDDLDDRGTADLFIRHGAFPTPTDFDISSTGASNHELVVPIAEAGDWYALVRGVDAAGDYELTMDVLKVYIAKRLKRYINPQHISKINKFVGILLFSFGIILMARVLVYHFHLL